jgi:tetratricopeptide (TPR) repeat protein
VTLLLYWPVHTHTFVDYDDADYVTANPQVQAGLTWAGIKWAFTAGHASNWHPVTWLSHMLDCQLFGEQAGAHLLVNAVLHTLNSILLFLLLRRWTGAHWPSAVVAALFAWHPLHVESVAWISERKDVLSTLFFLLTLDAYGRFVDRRKLTPVGWRPVLLSPAYWGAMAFFALGLMSKPMLVTLPFVLLLVDYWPLGRLTFSDPKSSARALAGLALEKAPFFVVCALSSLVTYLVQQKGGAVSQALSLGDRVANAIVSYGRYLGKMFWPVDLSVLYPHPGQWPLSTVLLCSLVLLAITVVAVARIRRWPFFTVGWFWYVGTLVPVIGLVQVGIQSMADRYSYIPLIGSFVAMVWGLTYWNSLRRWGVAWLAVPAGLALGACLVLTSRQIEVWRDSESLFQNAVRVTANNYLAHNNLGYYYSSKGQVDRAIEHYRQSIAIHPSYDDALNNLGFALAGRRQFAEAIGYYEAALRVRPRHVEVHNNLGNALSELGRIDEAIAHYQVTLAQKPDHADAHNNLGIALAMKGKLAEAIPHFQNAIRFKPKYASAHSNLGNALAAQGKLDEAIAQYQETLRLNPSDAQAHNNLGNVFMEQGKVEQGVASYREALRLNTDNPEAHCNLGIALLRQGNRPEAIRHFSESVRLRPDYEPAKRQLEALRSASTPSR